MNRRVLGVALLMLTALMAVVAPGITGVQVSGIPAGQLVPAPPVIGACVLDDPRFDSRRPGEVAALAYGHCGGAHFGEVMWVFDTSGNTHPVHPGQTDTPEPSACKTFDSSYLGVDQVVPRFDRGDFRSTSFGAWLPLSTGADELIGPSRVQRAVGQHWIACITESGRGTAFVGTVRGAFTGGKLPDAYAICAQSLTATTPVDCALPHRAEMFATTGMIYNMPAADALYGSCLDFVHYLTRRTDLSAAGRLRIEATPVHYDITGHPKPDQTDPVQAAPATASCGITTVGKAELTATLFGVGDGPLPFS